MLDDVACATAQEEVNKCAGTACTDCVMSTDGVIEGFVEEYPSCDDLAATSFCEDVEAATEGCSKICARGGNCSTEMNAMSRFCQTDDEKAEWKKCPNICGRDGPAAFLRSS